MVKKLSNKQLNYYRDLGINVDGKYFRSQYRRGLLRNIDEEYIDDIQNYYSNHYKQIIDPVTHIAFTNLTGIKNVQIMPQYLFRREFLRVFNDNPLTDIYRDKALYDLMFDTENQAYNVIKRIRGTYYNHQNEQICFKQVIDILLNDSKDYIIKPSDTNNGLNINKLTINQNKALIGDKEIGSEYLDKVYGYNFVIQRLLKQDETMAYLHPASVNTLRMVTFRWDNRILNLYTFARFGHNNDIKDNAGSGGVIVGVNNDGSFKEFGIQKSKIITKHPTSQKEIDQLGYIPNYESAKAFVRYLHSHILHHNYVAWDIVIDQNKTPIFLEANFFGSSWTNQIALKSPMLGSHTGNILEYIAENQNNVGKLNAESLAYKNRLRYRKRVGEFEKQIGKLKAENLKYKSTIMRLERKVSELEDNGNILKRLYKMIMNK